MIFNREKAGGVDQTQKPVFLKIADEEQKHFTVLESIIDMVSRPQTWLENRERSSGRLLKDDDGEFPA